MLLKHLQTIQKTGTTMSFINVKLSNLILLIFIFFSLNAYSATLSCLDNQSALVCSQKRSDDTPTNVCVKNVQLHRYFKSNPLSIIGNCSQFDIKKIQTYACNAGLRFIPRSKNICIKKDQGNTVSTTCGDSLNCVCSNDSATEINTNYFNYGKANYGESVAPLFIKYSTDASMTSEYAVASGNTGSDILEDGSALQFNFGSEFYGAEYFVDICIKNNNIETTDNILKLNGKLIFGNAVFNTTNYITSSALDTNVETTCIPSNGKKITITQLSSGPFISGERRFSEVNIPSAPLCVVRHYFKETNSTDLRKNNYKKVTFQTFTDVTPRDSSQLTPSPSVFCNITYDGKNKTYICEQRNFKDNDAFLETLLNQSPHFFGPNTYTGQCPVICKLF